MPQYRLLGDCQRFPNAFRLGTRRGIFRQMGFQQLGYFGRQLSGMLINDQGEQGCRVHGFDGEELPSDSRRARTSANALWRRERTVPIGMSSASAISA